MENAECRMCGEMQNSSNMSAINDELVNLIEYHCRITLSLHDSKYPDKVCFECNHSIVSFSKFTEIARDNQLKLIAKFQNVKVEIEEFPLIVEYDNGKPTYLLRTEPKKEEKQYLSDGSESDHSANDKQDDDFVPEEQGKKRACKKDSDRKANEGSDYDNTSADSDSDYVGNKYYKRKRKAVATRQRRVRMKKPKINQGGGVAAILNEVPEEDRYKNGCIRKKSLSTFEGKTWKDMSVSCTKCEVVVDGPCEMRKHHFKYHSLDSEYKCSTCTDNLLLSCFYQFLNHAIEHQESLRFCCVLCSEMFWNTKSLNSHYEASHETRDRAAIFHCLRCGQYFRKALDLTNHESRIHYVDAPQDEPEPKPSLFTMESLYEKELKLDVIEQKIVLVLPDEDKNPDGSLTQQCIEKFSKHTWENVTTYQCTQCAFECSTVYKLYEHFNAEHSGLKHNFTCKTCPDQKVFLNMESYINHTFTIHHEHLRYFCFICSAGYWNYKSMYEHYKLKHEDYKVFICLYCGKYHKCGYDIRHHKAVHSQKSEKPAADKSKVFTCSACPKSFSRQKQLQRHLDTHVKNDGKVWICETCGTSFSAKSTLINHAMVHQTDKPFVCETCGEGFKNKYKLKHHKGIHTGERNFACEICGSRFRAKGTLKGHMLTHTGERNFKCEFCDKTFAAKYDLLVHTRLHTGEFTHECPVCHERYPSWSNYSKHMRGRHNIDPRSEKKKKYDALHKGSSSQNDMNIDSSSSSQYYQM